MGDEVIGLLQSVDECAVWILDDEGDNIEINHVEFGANTREKILTASQKLVGKRVSYAYDSTGLVLRPMASNEPTVMSFGSFKNPKVKQMSLKRILREEPPDEEKDLWLFVPLKDYSK